MKSKLKSDYCRFLPRPIALIFRQSVILIQSASMLQQFVWKCNVGRITLDVVKTRMMRLSQSSTRASMETKLNEELEDDKYGEIYDVASTSAGG